MAHHAAVSVRERGYAVVPHLFSSHDAHRIAQVAMRIASSELAANPNEPFTVDRDAHGHPAPRKIDYPFLKAAAFRRFVLDHRLQHVVNAALGQRGYLMRDQVFCKPPRFGTAKPYHQENASLHYQPADNM
ncbi:MAG: phytanoyl-CoA dioxygenase family protein, partial [Sciscionella sp.]